MRTENYSLVDTTMWVIVALGIFATWYFVWVGPRDAYLASMVSCMERAGDYSEDGYIHCTKEHANESR